MNDLRETDWNDFKILLKVLNTLMSKYSELMLPLIVVFQENYIILIIFLKGISTSIYYCLTQQWTNAGREITPIIISNSNFLKWHSGLNM